MLIALLALLLAAPGGALADVELYRPAHRSAVELAELAGPLLAPDGFAIADPQTGSVLLRGDKALIQRAVEVLRGLDVAPVQFRIESETTSRAALSGMGVDVDGWIQAGDLTIGRMAHHGRHEGSSVGIEARSYSTQDAQRFSAFVVVLEGRTAEIWTGTSYPVVVREIELGPYDRRVIETLPQLEARSGFSVRPRSLGDGQIELEIVSVRANPLEAGAIQETGAATRVRVAPGEQLAIATVGTSDHGHTAELLARGSYSSQSEEIVLIRATPLDPPAPARQ